jgi:hypothetical protein
VTDKDTCDLCGKSVGQAALWRRIGFTPGSRANKVCGTCYNDKLPRSERLRFHKAAASRKKAEEAEAGDEDAWRPEAPRPPDELRF